MRILAPSIVDPVTHGGGAGAVLRGLKTSLGTPPLGAEIEWLTPRCVSGFRRVRQLAALGRSVGSRDPAKAWFTRSRGFRDAVAQRLGDHSFDLLLLGGSDLLWLLDALPERPPTLLVAFNLEHELYRAQLRRLRVPRVLRRWLERDLEKLRRFEARGLSRIDRVLFVSRDEARRHTATPAMALPPLFDAPRFARGSFESLPDSLRLGFLGNLEWWPNRVGLEWFVGEVLPAVGGDVALHVFGRGRHRFARGRGRVEAQGFVPDLHGVWKRCDLMICPIADGAGVNVKLAEALDHGMSVLARPFAARGLDLPPATCLALRETAAEWIEWLSSSEARRHVARAVPEALSLRFSARHHAPALQSFVVDAAGGRTR